MIICFILSMPNRGSWNGQWSGQDKLFAITRNLGRGRKNDYRGEVILAKRSYYHGWPDGWGASVSVKEVSAAEARKIKAKSAGFCGYEWMIDSIIRDGAIYSDFHPKPANAERLAASPVQRSAALAEGPVVVAPPASPNLDKDKECPF